jgi:hypothetical protein
MHSLKNLSFLFLTFILFSKTYAQEKAVKLNFGAKLTETERTKLNSLTSLRVEKQKNIDFGKITPSFINFYENSNFLEFEISDLSFTKENYEQDVIVTDSVGNARTLPTDGGESESIKLGFRYEYTVALIKNKTTKFKPYLGFGLNPHFNFTSFSPYTSNKFYMSQKHVGLLFQITPRVIKHLNEKWFLDLNIPISIGEVSYSNFKDTDPSRSAQERVISTIDLDLFPINYQLKLGIGLKI